MKRFGWIRSAGWRGLLPVQRCYICGRAYWAGFPTWSLRERCWTWRPEWMEYCSKGCYDADLEWCVAASEKTLRDSYKRAAETENVD